MKNGDIWPDNNNSHINAHGGGILSHENLFYWFGEHKTEGWEGRLAYHGVHCYTSHDLKNWRDEGIVLHVSDDPSSPIHKGCRIERPKVIFNKTTGKFVMWFHSTDANHTIASSGVAVSDTPLGPYQFLYAKRPDALHWPLNVTPEDKREESMDEAKRLGESSFSNGANDFVPKHNILGRDFNKGQMARDMNLFVDDDGTAYHLYASEHNSTLHISKLSDDYLDHSGEYVRAFPHRWMEAPAMFKNDGRYFLIMSDCTGWDPNAARGGMADHPFGPWKEIGNPCRGTNPTNGLGAEKTFGSQSSFVLQIKGQHIAMFDLWQSKDFIDSRYLWLPIVFIPDGYEVHWKDEIPL